MANRPLSERDLQKIVESDEFWKDLDTEEGGIDPTSNNNDIDDKRTACGAILNNGDESDSNETDGEEYSEHDSESELDWEPNDEEIVNMEKSSTDTHDNSEPETREVSSWYGKDRTKWSKIAPTRRKTKAQNIIKVLPGLKGPACQNQPSTALEAWKYIITDSMISKIVTHTNSKIRTMQSKYKKFKKRHNSRSTFAPVFIDETNKTEIEALFGLLYLLGSFKSGHEDLRSLWATDGTGRYIFRCTMSLARFSFLLCCLRFDDEVTRIERLKENKLAAISEIYNDFVQNSKNCYSPGEFLTIDEMLVPFRGRCKFRMYIPSKPARYGLKVQILADSKTHYMINSEIYSGKKSEKSQFSIPTDTVLRLVDPVDGTNRNITGDNWYTSLELTNELLKKKLTYVGTVKRNKRFIPPEFLPSKKREDGTSLFGFTSNHTIVSHVPKKNKAVLLISTMHNDNVVDDATKKPDIILFYNDTKAGVDSLDQKCANYSTSRRTRRWPMAIFHMILNVSGINSRILYQFSQNGKEIARLDFLKTLGRSLCEAHMKLRIYNTKIPRKLRDLTADILGIVVEVQEVLQQHQPVSKRKRCAFCPPKKDRKTNTFCDSCKTPVCQQCTKKMCPKCV